MIESEAEITGFADDTSILYTAQSWESLPIKAQRDFTKIKNWFVCNLLTVNFEKTNFVNFTSYHSDIVPKLIKINGDSKISIIKSADHVKYLGLIIDKHMR